MRVSEAHVLSPVLSVHRRDVTAEREALERLAAWAGQYTSFVSLVSPDALLLEVEGSRNLYGGLERLSRQVRQGLNELGYDARVAVAPTPLGATWLAQAEQEVEITDHAALFSALAKLPLTCLRLSPEREVLLKGLGLATLVDCLRLPRDGIARRAGQEMLQLLDRAFGRLPDPRPAFIAPERFRVRLGLPGPVATREALLFPIHRLLLELAGFLSARGAGATALALTLHSTRSAATYLSLKLVTPSRDAVHMTNLVRERLAQTELAAPAEEIRLDVDALLPLGSQPVDFFAGAESPERQRAQLLERFQARLGRDMVHGLVSEPDHRPERAWSYTLPGTETKSFPNDPFGRRWPVWLLSKPIALDVREGQLHWEGGLAIEPEHERIESGWWDGEDVARDYFIARGLEGRRFWVYRNLQTKQWFLHGMFG